MDETSPVEGGGCRGGRWLVILGGSEFVAGARVQPGGGELLLVNAVALDGDGQCLDGGEDGGAEAELRRDGGVLEQEVSLLELRVDREDRASGGACDGVEDLELQRSPEMTPPMLARSDPPGAERGR